MAVSMTQNDAFTLAQRINDFNAASGRQSMLGGNVNVVSVSNTAVGLRHICNRPIVAGVRGITMKINVQDLREIKSRRRYTNYT